MQPQEGKEKFVFSGPTIQVALSRGTASDASSKCITGDETFTVVAHANAVDDENRLVV